MEKQKIEISIVIPIFDEKESIRELHNEISGVMTGLKKSYEVIFVDDGSADNSIEVLKEIKNRDKTLKIIQLRKNFGKSAALSAGFKFAQGDIVITMDGDLQDVPDEIPKFMEKINEGYDLVSGWRYKRKDPVFKMILSGIFNRVTSLTTGVGLHDSNCGFKAYRKEILENVEVYGELHRYLPAFVYWKGYNVTELRVNHRARKCGHSKYGLERLPRAFFDLFTVSILTRYAGKPLHFFGGTGLVFLSLGFVILLYLAMLWFSGQGIGQRPLLLLGVLLVILGIQLFSIGLLGEMITSMQHKNEYLIKQ